MTVLCDPYQILMVRPNASAPEIRAAFRALIAQWHPDVATSPDAHQRSAAIIQAYRTLSHPERRSQADRRRQSTGAPGGRERRGQKDRRVARSPGAMRALTLAWFLVAGATVATGVATELPDRNDTIMLTPLKPA